MKREIYWTNFICMQTLIYAFTISDLNSKFMKIRETCASNWMINKEILINKFAHQIDEIQTK